MIRILLALLLVPTLAWADEPPVADTKPPPAPPPGPPAGPEVPFVIKCYQHDMVPFLVTDGNGKTLFEIRCP
jgi:hypothetical protein